MKAFFRVVTGIGNGIANFTTVTPIRLILMTAQKKFQFGNQNQILIGKHRKVLIGSISLIG